MMSDLVGKKLDVYKIIRLIGDGGMGVVYEAEHSIMGRRCAIKVMKSDAVLPEELLARMIREAQAASAIGHPNIVQVFDFRQAPDGTYFMAMELLSGQPLSALFRVHGRLEIYSAVAVMAQVLSGVWAAHSKGIVHRDLKPENIFIAETQAGNHEIKLLDFGISKFMRPSPESLRITKTGAVLGTPYYMSPEQAAGKKDIAAATDIWSCGAILYELVTGAVPFAGTSYNQVMAAVLMEPVNRPTLLRPECPAWLEEIICRALEKNPNDRCESASEFLNDLLAHHRPGDVPVGPFVLRHTMPPSVGGTDSVRAQLPPSGPDLPPPPGIDGKVVFDSPTAAVEPGQRPRQTFTDGERVSQRLPDVTLDHKKRKLLYGLVAGGCVLMGVLVVTAIVIGTEKPPKKKRPAKGGDKTYVSRPSGLAIDDGSAPAQLSRPDAGPTGRPSTPTDASTKPVEDLKTITITLKNLPRKATVTLDGSKVKAPIRIKADGKRRCVEVHIPGQPLYARCFDALGDRLFRIPVQPRKKRRRPRRFWQRFGDPYRHPSTRPRPTRGMPFRDPYKRSR